MSLLKRFGFLALSIFVSCTANLQSNEDVIDGQPGGEKIVIPDVLNCETILMCDSHRLPQETVTIPGQGGGVIEEGIYKAVAGVNQPMAIIFKNGRFSRLSWNLLVGNGTFEVDGTVLTTYLETACSPNSDPGGNDLPQPIPTEYRFSAMGDDLYLEAKCISARCDPTILLRRVDSLCSADSLSGENCEISSCSCHEFVEQGMPDRAEGDDECAIQAAL